MSEKVLDFDRREAIQRSDLTTQQYHVSSLETFDFSSLRVIWHEGIPRYENSSIDRAPFSLRFPPLLIGISGPMMSITLALC